MGRLQRILERREAVEAEIREAGKILSCRKLSKILRAKYNIFAGRSIVHKDLKDLKILMERCPERFQKTENSVQEPAATPQKPSNISDVCVFQDSPRRALGWGRQREIEQKPDDWKSAQAPDFALDQTKLLEWYRQQLKPRSG